MKKILCAIAISGTLVGAESSPEKTFPVIENGREYNLFGISEFLYWRFSSPELIYGRNGVGGVPGTPEGTVTSGTVLLPDFTYDPGFRVGLGIKFGPSKAFDLIGYYTWLYSNPSQSASGNAISSTFQPTNFFNIITAATNVYSSASLNVHVHLNIPELQSGYTFHINRYFALRPYIALTALIIDGDLRAQYEFTSSGVFEIGKTHGECNSWSIGPKAGLDVIYNMSFNWGIFFNVNLSQQFTHLVMKTQQTQKVPATGAEFLTQKGHLTENRNITLLSLEIGPSWETWFCKDKYHLYLRATYQGCNLNNGANLSFLNNNNVDLILQTDYRGLNVRALFEF